MNLHRILNAIFLLSMAAPMVSAGVAQGSWNAPAIVVRNCSGCHGLDGNAQLPYVPRLSGQNATYAEKKMTGYRAAPLSSADELVAEVARLGRSKTAANATPESRIYMAGPAHAVTPEEMTAAVEWYAGQTPGKGRSGKAALIEKGRFIFERGRPSQKLMACQTCHGRQAEGQGIAPRLAGQNASYVVSQLALFRAGDRQHAPEMTAVVQNLDPDQVLAVAAYLQAQ